MKKTFISKIIPLAATIVMMSSVVAYANGRNQGGRPDFFYEVESNDSRALANDCSGLKYYLIRGNVSPNDVDYFKLNSSDETGAVSIYIHGGEDVMNFDLISEDGTPVTIPVYTNTTVNLEKGKNTYIRVNTGLKGNYSYGIEVTKK